MKKINIKIIFLSITLILCSVINTSVVKASSLNKEITLLDVCEDDSYFGSVSDSSSPAYWMQYILNIMKYIAIVALIVLSTIDFIKALVAQDSKAVKKAGGTAVKRLIYCVLIFFLPNIVELIMEWFGAYGTCGIE